jgi:hypothetical protein
VKVASEPEALLRVLTNSAYEHGTASPCCIAWHFDFMKMLFS